MIALVVGLTVAALLVWVLRPARHRDGRRTAAMASSDAPSRLLSWAVSALPADRAPWGEAMSGELRQMDNRRQRWRFAVSLLLLAIPIASLAVGATAARRNKTAAVRQQVVLFSALAAGLILFLVYASDILLTAGGPYDAGQVRDFPGSGLPDMATYAVSDNLGSAIMLLLFVPAVTAAIGCTGAGIAARLPHPTK